MAVGGWGSRVLNKYMEFCPKNFSFFRKKITFSKQPKKQNKLNFYFSLSGVLKIYFSFSQKPGAILFSCYRHKRLEVKEYYLFLQKVLFPPLLLDSGHTQDRSTWGRFREDVVALAATNPFPLSSPTTIS